MENSFKNNNNKQKEQEETFGGDGYVYGIDSRDGFMGVYLSPNSSNMYSFLYVNHTSIKWFKKRNEKRKLLQKQALPFVRILKREGECMPA